MIPGTGPGRGVPWWRLTSVLSHRWTGFIPEPAGAPREGRLIRTIEFPPRRLHRHPVKS